MASRVLITGSSGLVGRALRRALESSSDDVCCLDLLAHGHSAGDLRDAGRVRSAAERVDGIVHLAAVSRVAWAERDPDACISTNVDGTRNILRAAADSPRRPWVLFASSREVYGEPAALPVDEGFPLAPLNVYGRSKVDGEALVAAARRDGVRASVVRLSNVYGAVSDHVDRVIPAFLRAALADEPLHVEGAERVFDFTHVEDVAAGVATFSRVLAARGASPPPIQLVSGTATTLSGLATLVKQLVGSKSPIWLDPGRHFDVTRFVGNPALARKRLGWTARTDLEEGLRRLIRSLRDGPVTEVEDVAR